MNAAVVPEKYRSARPRAHAGTHCGKSAGRRTSATSSVIPQHLPQVRLEDRGRLLELVGETRQVLELADGFLRLPHALGGGVDLTAEEIRVLTVPRHLGQRLDLAFSSDELDRDELGVL